MRPLEALGKRLQFVERAVPPRWRLPLRYHGQRLLRALEPEMALLDELVPPGAVALDVGANRGVYAYALARRASVVHCFEPLAECCRYIADFSSPRIAVHNVALSDKAGVLRLHVPLRAGQRVLTRASLAPPSGPFELREVEVRTLDSFGLPRVDFIKIDVEGLERAVLEGARGLLTRDRPRLLVEIMPQSHTPDAFAALFTWLGDFGYRAHVVRNGALRPSDDPWTDGAEQPNFVLLPG